MNHEDRALLLGMLRSHKIASISGCESKLLSYVLLRGIKVMKAISFHKNITDAGLAHLAGGCEGLTSVVCRSGQFQGVSRIRLSS